MTANLRRFNDWTVSQRVVHVDVATDDQGRPSGWYLEYCDGSWIQLQDGGTFYALAGNRERESLDLTDVEEWLWEAHAKNNFRTLADRTAEQRAARKR
jgi:hypothetical protein